MKTQECKGCKEVKSLSRFDKSSNMANGYINTCKDCGAEGNRDRALKRKYRITLAEYNELLAGQGGKCKNCSTDTPGGRGDFHVDHCHDTGAIRGLLCSHCNTGLGKLGDTVESLKRALAYLEGEYTKYNVNDDRPEIRRINKVYKWASNEHGIIECDRPTIEKKYNITTKELFLTTNPSKTCGGWVCLGEVEAVA